MIEAPGFNNNYIEVPCVCHDNPVMMVPKQFRRTFFDELIKNDEFKWKLFTEKEYDWVFKGKPCIICQCLYDSLLKKLKNPNKVYEMVYARPYKFNRRLGEGISVYNSGDRPIQQNMMSNAFLQRRINALFGDSNQVKYIFSQFAKTNNGIYALMDVKSFNTERLVELHNIVSEGVHKVEDLEENVDSLFIALMNPEDKKNIRDFPSFSDRIEFINIPYVLDFKKEIKIYKNIFGKHIADIFLPRILNNFTRIIISSRLNERSAALLEWIGDPLKYKLYCDEKLHLLKMEIYSGNIPSWLNEADRNKLNAKRRRKIIEESEIEGNKGFSGRDAIKIFDDFYSTYSKKEELINMSTLVNYFTKKNAELSKFIPNGFLESMQHMYNYLVLQEVKESLYYYNEEQISKDIQNYMFAINFEYGESETCSFTGDKIDITVDYLESIENRIFGGSIDKATRLKLRKKTQHEYTTNTLTQEILVDAKDVKETKLYKTLTERFVHNLKEKVLDSFLKNENFRRAIKDFNIEDFKTYDKRIRNDVTFLIENLISKILFKNMDTQTGEQKKCVFMLLIMIWHRNFQNK